MCGALGTIATAAFVLVCPLMMIGMAVAAILVTRRSRHGHLICGGGPLRRGHDDEQSAAE